MNSVKNKNFKSRSVLECWDSRIYLYFIPAKPGALSPPLIKHFSRLYHRASIKPGQGTPSDDGRGSQTKMSYNFLPSYKANTKLWCFSLKGVRPCLFWSMRFFHSPEALKWDPFCSEKGKDYPKLTHQLLEH